MTMKFALLALVVAWLAWDVGVAAFGIAQRPPWALKRLLAQRGEPPVLLDVRTPQEFAIFHIHDAVNVPAPQLPTPEQLMDWKGRDTVVICMTGHRSPIMAWRLRKAGLGTVSNLTWGMVGWKLFGGESVRSAEP
ncbi:rhodanese-related sulfurtransferase [Desulfobaculum xiamenense]|uniref:Rhodanese-related sulfurtransferase n=1 Tax=Desulfobaculum xiamenense TaxID=995050 RepID=A0A846QJ55_9BACT|nr:rhodanese-like domain-containing protein [Desulfobaculum xiamenense]NJB68191.1 rhodanese-related sulfurtransferase [Desulfobaculum xiamenense]